MAVQAIPADTDLVLRLQTGVNENGDPVFTNRRYGNVKTDATDQALYDVAAQIAGLQVHTLNSVMRDDRAYIEEQV